MENFGLFLFHLFIFFYFIYYIYLSFYLFIYFRIDRCKFEECKSIVLSQQNNEELWKSIKFKVFDIPNLNENEKGK